MLGNLEDYHLSLAFDGMDTGTYIDVGAGHPIADNVSFWFYERGWRGIVVEPQRQLAELYKYLRPRDVVHCGLAGSKVGEADFHIVDRLHGFSTTLEDNARRAEAFGSSYRTERKSITTLAELCKAYDVHIVEFLKIDVEGTEADVLFGNDWDRFRPKVILAEAIKPGSGEPAWHEWEPYLLAKGYEFVLFDTLNQFYVAKEQPLILERFPRERAAWDSARHMYEIGRAPENTLHPDHALARELARGFWAHLPYLGSNIISEILEHARQSSAWDSNKRIDKLVTSEAFRASLGRIACGYDGGQIFDDE